MSWENWPQYLMAGFLISDVSVAIGSSAVQWMKTERKKTEIIAFAISRIVNKSIIAIVLTAGGFWV